MKRLHTLMLFLVFLFIGVSPDTNATTVNQTLKCDSKARAGQPGACPTTYELYEGDATYRAAIDKALNPVGLKECLGKTAIWMVLMVVRIL